MASKISKMYKNQLTEDGKDVEMTSCNVEDFQVDLMKKAGWLQSEAEAAKVTKAKLEKTTEK